MTSLLRAGADPAAPNANQALPRRRLPLGIVQPGFGYRLSLDPDPDLTRTD